MSLKAIVWNSRVRTRRMLTVWLVALAVGWAPDFHSTALAQQPDQAPTSNWLLAKVVFLNMTQKVKVYVGDGDDLYVQIPFGMSGTPEIAMMGSHSYFAGEVSASPTEMLLDVVCEFKNVSAATQTFNPLQVELGGEGNALIAAKTAGPLPFAKDEATWDRLKRLPELKPGWGEFKPGEDWMGTQYVFRVSKAASAWRLTYRGSQLAELRPDKK